MLLIILAMGEDLRGPAYEYGFDDLIELFGIAGTFLILGAPIAYLVTAVFGLPCYLIARKLGYINFWSVSFGSAFVAVLPLLLVAARNGLVINAEPGRTSCLVYLAFALTGYFVGTVFWFVSGLYEQSAHKKQRNSEDSLLI